MRPVHTSTLLAGARNGDVPSPHHKASGIHAASRMQPGKGIGTGYLNTTPHPHFSQVQIVFLHICFTDYPDPDNFSWEKYLKDTGSTAVPAHFFKMVSTGTTNWDK